MRASCSLARVRLSCAFACAARASDRMRRWSFWRSKSEGDLPKNFTLWYRAARLRARAARSFSSSSRWSACRRRSASIRAPGVVDSCVSATRRATYPCKQAFGLPDRALHLVHAGAALLRRWRARPLHRGQQSGGLHALHHVAPRRSPPCAMKVRRAATDLSICFRPSTRTAAMCRWAMQSCTAF